MVDFRNFDPDEEQIATLFKLHWKLNYARVQIFKKKFYPFLFVQPDEETERIFNIKEDLVILFLRNDKFDDKDLDFFDDTYQKYSNRIDERILILVSRDEKIKRELEKLANERMQTRLLIPYTYKELLETKENVGIRKKLEKIYYGKDLYSYDSPLNNDTFFFGRTDITKEIINEYDLGKSFGLFGLRRLGKTSVLFSVRRQLSVRKKLSVYFNFQNPSLPQKKWYELLQFISQTIQIEICNKIDDTFIDVELVEYDEKNAAEEFKADLEFFRDKIGDKILICFDEIEQISPKTAALSHWKSGTDTLFFWQTLRYVIEENRELIGLLIAGSRRSAKEKING